MVDPGPGMTTRPDALRVVRPLELPADRGRLLTAEAIVALIGGISPAWVRRHVPGKLRLGQRTVRWYEGDVLAWIASRHAPALPPPARLP